MSKEYVCDLAHPVWGTPNNIGTFTDGRGKYCAVGKLMSACGEDWNTMEGVQFLVDVLKFESGHIYNTNDTGDYELATRMALEVALKSGKVKFINGNIDSMFTREMVING